MMHLEPLKIAMVTDNYYPKTGGVEYCVDALARYLTKLGHHVTIITHTMPNQPKTEQKGLLFIQRTSYSELLALLSGISSRSKIDFSQFDVIHAHSLSSILAVLSILIAKKTGKAHVLTSHSLYGSLDRFFLKLLAQFVNHTICVSQAVVKNMLSMNKKMTTYCIPNGFDTNSPNGNGDFFGMKRHPDKLIVTTVSRLTNKKAVSDFIKIANVLLKKYNSLRFIVVGDGPQRKVLQQTTQKLCISEHVLFTGNLPRTAVFNLIQQSDIFVLASPLEAFGMVILEAIYHKIPIVARNNNGISDFITSGHNGYLASSIQEMTNHIMQLIDNPKLRIEFANNAHGLVNKFQWDNIALQTEKVYRELFSNRIDPVKRE